MSLIERVVVWCKDNVAFCILAAFILGFIITLYVMREKIDDQTEIVISGVEDEEGKANSEIVVDLAGAVNKPGVYTLPLGSRISDLLRLGEGFLSDASATWVARNLNLSLLLDDAQKVYIPFEWDLAENTLYEVEPLVFSGSPSVNTTTENYNVESPNSSGEEVSAVSESLIDVNSVSLEELDALPGIGPKYAQKIIDGRTYSSFDELVAKSGVPESTIKKIKDLISY